MYGRVTHICVSRLTIIGSDNDAMELRLSCTNPPICSWQLMSCLCIACDWAIAQDGSQKIHFNAWLLWSWDNKIVGESLICTCAGWLLQYVYSTAMVLCIWLHGIIKFNVKLRLSSKFKVAWWAQHNIWLTFLLFHVNWPPPIPEIWLFENLILKIQVLGHVWGQRSRWRNGSNNLSTQIPFIPCHSAIPFLGYAFFKISPWKSKVKIIAPGHRVGLASYQIHFVPCQYTLPFLKGSHRLALKIFKDFSMIFQDNNPKFPW